MPFSYKPLWKQLVDLDMTRKEFAKMSGISVSTLTRMGRNDYISLKIVDDICSLLNCTPNDVMEHVTEEELKNEIGNGCSRGPTHPAGNRAKTNRISVYEMQISKWIGALKMDERCPQASCREKDER